MSDIGSVLGPLFLGLVALYIVALGFGMVVAQERGVAYVNRIARRIAAWPVELLGKALVALAQVIRG